MNLSNVLEKYIKKVQNGFIKQKKEPVKECQSVAC